MADFASSAIKYEKEYTGKCYFNEMHPGDLLYCLSFLGTLDTARVNQVSRRTSFFSEKLGSIQPSLATASSESFEPRKVVLEALKESGPGKPNTAFLFYNQHETRNQLGWLKEATSCLPSSCALLAANSQDVQVNVSHHEKISAMIGSFPEAKPHTFCFEVDFSVPYSDNDSDEDQEILDTRRFLANFTTEIPPRDYTTFVVYSAGEGSRFTEKVIERIQKEYPSATIIGGICAGGCIVKNNFGTRSHFAAEGKSLSIKDLVAFIRKNSRKNLSGLEKSDLIDLYVDIRLLDRYVHDISDGVFGMAIAGICPLRSVVSRGVRSLSTGKVTTATDPTPCLKIAELDRGTRAHEHALIEGVVLLKKLVMPEDGKFIGTSDHIINALQQGKRPQYIGVRASRETGFVLHELSNGMIRPEYTILEEDGRDRIEVGHDVDLFSLDPESCMEDLEATLTNLQRNLQSEKLLGALMFSCAGRGPHTSMLPIEMADATCFKKLFPTLPLTGFYAGGEIGPEARAANSEENVFMQGRVKLQGFTVVFGVFIVPKIQLRDYQLHISADTPAMYEAHAQAKLSAK